MGNFAVFDLTESGEKIGRGNFLRFSQRHSKKNWSVLFQKVKILNLIVSFLHAILPFYGQYSIPRQSDQPMTEIQEGDLYFLLGATPCYCPRAK